MGNSDWSTNNEKNYVDGLLSGKWVIRPRVTSRDELLKNYIRSASRRQRHGTFGTVDVKEIIKYASKLLVKINGEKKWV